MKDRPAVFARRDGKSAARPLRDMRGACASATKRTAAMFSALARRSSARPIGLAVLSGWGVRIGRINL
ncbi:MAG: hypothetical protein CL801_01655 [Citromicrobium sp.]|nr:hypothetical protein [Citromicrobium sp.]